MHGERAVEESTSVEPTVFVVDDDRQSRASVCALACSMGVAASSFPSAEEFLEWYDRQPGCLVTDVRMLGMSGIQLQKRLAEMGSRLPVVVMTAYPRTPLIVRAMKYGAITLLDKPYDDDELWDAIRTGLAEDERRRAGAGLCGEVQRRLQRLSASEREVLNLIVAGFANKVIARRLDVSIRTVENRRREVFAKMKARSVAELVRLVLECEFARIEGS